MGSGASRNPTVGVPANPRVVYNDRLAKKEHDRTVLDAPVLVDVQHGSIRYRYSSYDGEPTDKNKRTERPFEGNETGAKQNYFYHARLKDFSQGADRSKEDDFKFLYVTKGPAGVQQKKLFYVYGRGMEAKDGTRIKPTETKEEGNDYSWPGLRVPNHLYYKLTFTTWDPDTPVTTTSEDDHALEDLKSTLDKSNMRFTLTKDETTREVRAKIAVKILKAASDIHICFGNLEFRDEDIVGHFQSEENRNREEFEVEVHFI